MFRLLCFLFCLLFVCYSSVFAASNVTEVNSTNGLTQVNSTVDAEKSVFSAGNSSVGGEAVKNPVMLPAWVTSSYPPYESAGKIDPFVSFIRVREYENLQAAQRARALRRVAVSPLENIDTRGLKVIGIVNSDSANNIAMVALPDGKGHVLRAGMKVGLYDGVVKEITADTVVVEEDFEDAFGEQKKRIINLKLRQEKE